MIPGRLVLPAIRWRPETGFAHEHSRIDAALAAGAGGFIVFGVPGARGDEVAAVVTSIRQRAGRPLLIGADLERGAGQQARRLTDIPPPGALASLADDEVVAWAGRTTALEALGLGINWVFAPVADLDREPRNPIVQTRSFGADPEAVSRQVATWVGAAQKAGVLACAKHYPGHGGTTQDSHDVTPAVASDLGELSRSDLLPFQRAIQAGVASIMTAHVSFPRWDASAAPATRSAVMLEHLRSSLGFDDLVVTDALMMEGARAGLEGDEALIAPLWAGCDLLLYPPDAAAAIESLDRAAGKDPRIAARVEASLARYQRALGRAGSADPASTADPSREAESRAIARRLLASGLHRGTTPDLRGGIDLVIVDDDSDAVHHPGPNDLVRRDLARVRAPEGWGGRRVILAFAEPRMSKGRTGFGEASREILAQTAPEASLVVLFGHPRLMEEIPGAAPVLLAWHRQPLMQHAVAEWLLERMR
jgi:beta-glucosidase-like glycosyl hydrolase